MFDGLKQLFGAGRARGERDTLDPYTAASALLVEAALVDGVYANMESDMIAEILLDSFPLDAQRVDQLIRDGERHAEGAISAHQFTKHVKTLPLDERAKVVEGLYRVALADGERCPYEDAFIRHVASLLHVDDMRRARARQAAEARVASEG